MDVAEELTEFEDLIDREHIERRILDWHRRILSLYEQISGWLPIGWSSQQIVDVAMNEPLMRNFSITERKLPSLALSKGHLSVRLEPRGLWIVGTNGRVDMVSFKGHDVLYDRADLYEEPCWMIAGFTDQSRPKSLTHARFLESLP